jgi:hypothetical protein
MNIYVMPLASTFLDEESMDGCIRKAVQWCEGLPSYDTTHVQKMELTETIGVFYMEGGDMAQWEREGGGVLQSNKIR